MIQRTGVIAGMIACAFALVSGQAAPVTGDFTNATTAEVRDDQGRVVLSGRFMLADESDDEIERRAALEPTGIHTDAVGEAEVEYSKDPAEAQELEFSVRNLPPGTVVTFVIDGTDVASAMTDGRGRAEAEVNVNR
jgi:hypothetical protein